LDADDLRKATAADREAVSLELQAVLQEVSGLISTMPIRSIDLE